MNEIKINDFLKTEREKRKIPLEEIHHKTKISISCLKSLEAGEWGRFPAPVYIHNFLRKYAACVGLSADEVVTLYESKNSSSYGNGSRIMPKKMDPEDSSKRNYRFWVIFILVLFSSSLLYWYWGLRETESSLPPSGTKTIGDGYASSAMENKTAAQDLVLLAHTSGTAWVRIRGDGNLLFEGFLRAGEEAVWKAKKDFTIRVGKAHVVKMTLNGREIPLEKEAVNGVNELELNSQFVEDGSFVLKQN